MLDIITLILIVFLTVILTVYNRRQAAALRGVERLVEDFVALQIRDRRAAHAKTLNIDPAPWLEGLINPHLDAPLKLVTDVVRVLPELPAAELRTADSRRVVVSTRPKADVRRFDRRLRASGGKSPASRLEAFGSRPLLKGRVQTLEITMSEAGEWFDLEAADAGQKLGLDWGEPMRLYCYIVS